ncbi:MAG: PIN domain-containing protein [Candidatus Micrarchaeia archaeon]
MKKVLIDTNFLFVPIEFGINLAEGVDEALGEPFEFYILKECLDEARKLRNYSTLERVAHSVKARVASAGEGKPDDLVLAWADANKAIVCTNDAGLKRRLKRRGLQVICLRGKSKLALA